MTGATDSPRHPPGAVVVAYTDESDTYPEVRRSAFEHAADHGCTVILYPGDVASAFSEPLPNAWASDGEADIYGNRLDPRDLEALGRAAIARQVEEGRRSGVTVVAWLPKDKGLDPMVAYAVEQGAHVLFAPASLDGGDPSPSRPVDQDGHRARPVDIRMVPVDGDGQPPG
jgi:hypothetical protein